MVIFLDAQEFIDVIKVTVWPSSYCLGLSSKLFCFALEFQFNVLEILLTQSSDADLECTIFANGNREAEMVM